MKPALADLRPCHCRPVSGSVAEPIRVPSVPGKELGRLRSEVAGCPSPSCLRLVEDGRRIQELPLSISEKW